MDGPFKIPGILRIVVSDQHVWHLHLRLLYTCPATLRQEMEIRVRQQVFPWLGEYFQGDPNKLKKLRKFQSSSLTDLNARFTWQGCRFTRLEPLELAGPMSMEVDRELLEKLEGAKPLLH